MAPRASARYAAKAVVGTAWILLRRNSVVIGRIPIGAPLVNIRADVVQTVRVRCAAADRMRTGGIVLQRQLVAPRVVQPFRTAARRTLPLRFGREANAPTRDAAQPIAIGDGFEPRDAHDWLLRIAERRRRRRMTGRTCEDGIFGIRHLTSG